MWTGCTGCCRGPAPLPHCFSQEAGNSSLFWKVPIVMPDPTGPGVKLRQGTADSCNTLEPASVCPGAALRLELFPDSEEPQKSRCLSGLRGPRAQQPAWCCQMTLWQLQPSGLDFVSRETSCESHARLSSSPAAQRSITCRQEGKQDCLLLASGPGWTTGTSQGRCVCVG